MQICVVMLLTETPAEFVLSFSLAAVAFPFDVGSGVCSSSLSLSLDDDEISGGGFVIFCCCIYKINMENIR